MTWLMVAYVVGIFPAAVAVAACDEWTSSWGRLPRIVRAVTAIGWPFALLVWLAWCLAYGLTVLPDRLGTRLAKKYKPKRMKETDGI